MSYGSLRWAKIGDHGTPSPGARIVAFTPSNNPELRYRVCYGEDLSILSEATHWAYLAPPADYFETV
jgi:hypothetical protein